jgi:hypothetical protein
MQKLIILIGLASVEKAQLARDLSVYLQGKGYSTRQLDRDVDEFADSYTQTATKSSTSEQIIIWNTPDDMEMDRLADVLPDVEAAGIEPFTVALLDTRTCDCFPTLREEMEQTADLTLFLPFELKEALWSISAQL